MKLLTIHTIFILNILISRLTSENVVQEQDFDENYIETTVEMITVETTTQEVIVITDIPQSDVEAALNLDVGDYTTQVFDYVNFGFTKIKDQEACYQQYIKCILNQGISTPVCSVNSPFEIPDGYVTYDSICDVYLDNCRRKRQLTAETTPLTQYFWRVLDVGRCVHFSSIHASLESTMRRVNGERPWTFIFYVFGSKDQSYKYNRILNHKHN